MRFSDIEHYPSRRLRAELTPLYIRARQSASARDAVLDPLPHDVDREAARVLLVFRIEQALHLADGLCHSARTCVPLLGDFHRGIKVLGCLANQLKSHV